MLSATASLERVSTSKGFYEKTILSLFSQMQKGRLNLLLPSGELVRIGNNDGSVTANIQVNKKHFFKRCLLYGDIGFGEAYVAGEWDTDSITHVIQWFLVNIEHAPSVSGSNAKSFALNALKWINQLAHLTRENSIQGSKKNIGEHYDLNNDFFSLFLDPTMTYSSGYFTQEGMSLEASQYAKYDRLCKQLRLQPSDHVLEIGSGWGGNAIYMAKHYGCRVTTITISEEQFKWAKEKIQEEGLENQVTILLQDYRNMTGSFDKIVSIEMVEAVGAKFLKTYFAKCNQLLKKHGVIALQAITCPDSRFESLRKGVDWIQKHIFPGSLLPSVGALNKAINETSDLSLIDLKDMGVDYATTLSLWHTAFNQQLAKVKQLGFSDGFIRKWNYYLCYCEAAFAMRNIHVMQLVYVRPNNLQR